MSRPLISDVSMPLYKQKLSKGVVVPYPEYSVAFCGHSSRKSILRLPFLQRTLRYYNSRFHIRLRKFTFLTGQFESVSGVLLIFIHLVDRKFSLTLNHWRTSATIISVDSGPEMAKKMKWLKISGKI